MRTIYARNSCLPAMRIEGLRRYAFAGDSMVYGHGVAPDQTLPSVAERQMNACCADPVEAVNLGISGNNLWNSWLDFKELPQVYDGLILTVCSNDMELFGRTYNVPYQIPRSPAWEKTHPCGAAVATCFADIAAFCRQLSLPVAVTYYNTFAGSSPERIAEILHQLCSEWGFLFIDTLPRVKELKLSRDELRVGESDEHPSARVHEAVGRYLVSKLEGQGWFAVGPATKTDVTAQSILSSAQAMMERDHYPPELAHDWVLRVLEIKLHRARRLEAMAGTLRSASAQPRAAAEAAERNHRWHVSQRLKAFLGRISTLEQGRAWAWNLCEAEEERVRLEELIFVLERADWPRLAQDLRVFVPAPQDINDHWQSEAAEFLDRSIADLQRSYQGLTLRLARLRNLPAPAETSFAAETAGLNDDLETLLRLTDRAMKECLRLKHAFARIDRLIADLNQAEERDYAARLVSHSLIRAEDRLGFTSLWPEKTSQVCDANYAALTTIEVTIRGKALADKPVYLVTAQVDFMTPLRLPVRDTGNFFSDGACKFIKLWVPLFYCGRLLFSVKPSLPSDRRVEVELVKVEVYNLPGQRQVLPPQHFHRDAYDRYVSAVVYLS